MPRYRVIYLVWLVGFTLIVGMWLHSAVRHTAVARISSSGTVSILWISGGALALEFTKYEVTGGFGRSRWHFSSDAPGRKQSFFGGFRWGAAPLGGSTLVNYRQLFEIPFWFFALAFTLLCLPFLLRANRKYNQARAALQSPKPET